MAKRYPEWAAGLDPADLSDDDTMVILDGGTPREVTVAALRDAIGGGAVDSVDGQTGAVDLSGSYTASVGARSTVFAGATPDAGTGSNFASSTAHFFLMRRQGADSNGAQIGYDFALAAGTYTVDIYLAKASGSPICDITLGGVTVSTGLDLYAASTTPYLLHVTGIVLPTTGTNRLLLTANSKNGSSAGYSIFFNAATITRTA